MPPNPTMPTNRVIHTWLRRSAPSSVMGLVVGIASSRGIQRTSAATVRAPMTATSVNALRHPNACPIQVATGTPTTFATESPIITIATALARLPGSAR